MRFKCTQTTSITALRHYRCIKRAPAPGDHFTVTRDRHAVGERKPTLLLFFLYFSSVFPGFSPRSHVAGQLPLSLPGCSRAPPVPRALLPHRTRPGRHRPRSAAALTVLPAAAGPCSTRESAASSILRMERGGSAAPGAEPRPRLSFSRRRLGRNRRLPCVPRPAHARTCAAAVARATPPAGRQRQNVIKGH